MKRPTLASLKAIYKNCLHSLGDTMTDQELALLCMRIATDEISTAWLPIDKDNLPDEFRIYGTIMEGDVTTTIMDYAFLEYDAEVSAIPYYTRCGFVMHPTHYLTIDINKIEIT